MSQQTICDRCHRPIENNMGFYKRVVVYDEPDAEPVADHEFTDLCAKCYDIVADRLAKLECGRRGRKATKPTAE